MLEYLLVCRIQHLLNGLIHHFQTSFIRERNIFDNIDKKTKEDLAVILLDPETFLKIFLEETMVETNCKEDLLVTMALGTYNSCSGRIGLRRLESPQHALDAVFIQNSYFTVFGTIQELYKSRKEY
jgi:hypothetical protein